MLSSSNAPVTASFTISDTAKAPFCLAIDITTGFNERFIIADAATSKAISANMQIFEACKLLIESLDFLLLVYLRKIFPPEPGNLIIIL